MQFLPVFCVLVASGTAFLSHKRKAPVDCFKCPNTVNYVGYMADPKDCTKFYMCVFHKSNPRIWKAVRKSCGPGLAWSQAILTCVRPAYKPCGIRTPCASGKRYYADLKNCNAFYQCGPATATRKCCPPGLRWIQQKSRCGYSKIPCKDRCITGSSKPGRCPPAWKGKSGCSGKCKTDWGCPGRQKCCFNGCSRVCMNPYQASTTTTTTTTTAYSTASPTSGGCSFNQVFYLPCSDLGTPFPRDHSCNKAYITNAGRVSRYSYGRFGPACRFNRYYGSKLEVPFFNNWFYGVRRFSATFWFKPYYTPKSYRLQYLLHNGDCKAAPSIAIYLYRKLGNWVLRTRINGRSVGDVPVKEYVWTFVALAYDGSRTVLYTWSNNKRKTIYNYKIKGAIKNNHCPVTFGKKVGGNTLHGLIDEVRIYKRTLTKSQVDSLRMKNRIQ